MITAENGAMGVPTECHTCASSNIEYREIESQLGGWPFIWFCHDCGARVGCHVGTNVPLGYMATRQIRKLRKKAHIAFDPIWRDKLLSRDNAYLWLAIALGLDGVDIHISQMTKDQLRKTVELSNAYYIENKDAFERRREKQRGKRQESYSRTMDKEIQAIAKRKQSVKRNRKRPFH